MKHLGFQQAEGHSITVAMVPVLFLHHFPAPNNPALADRNLHFTLYTSN